MPRGRDLRRGNLLLLPLPDKELCQSPLIHHTPDNNHLYSTQCDNKQHQYNNPAKQAFHFTEEETESQVKIYAQASGYQETQGSSH